MILGSTMNYMKKFASLPNLKDFNIEYNRERQHLYLDDPRILVRFAGYLKKNIMQKEQSKVFFRGQTKDYGTMIPRLFRGHKITDITLKNRYSAYNDLLKKLKETYKSTRFKKGNVGALLQHYGINTPWLDLVDNVYTAIWFATMERGIGKAIEYVESDEDFGWIYFIKTKLSDGTELKSCDLREVHSSLSLRLHAQHGISVRRKGAVWNLKNRCLNDFVVATVKFPNNDNWKLKGHLFDTKFMFPSTLYDHTYTYLKKDRFTELINSITRKYHLSDGELGEIDDYIK
jgi:hypothetical protein